MTDGTPRVGIYLGTAAIPAVDAFASWLGRGQLDATDYTDPADAESDQADANGAAWTPVMSDRWGGWAAAAPDADNRRFILGLPLTPKPDGSLAEVAAGLHDGLFDATAAALVAHGLTDTVVRLGYEPNNPGIGPWHGTTDPAVYRAAFRRAVFVLRSVTGGRFTVELDQAVGPAGAATSFDVLYPGDDVVDIVGLNIYDVWWGTTASPAERWTYIHDRPMGIADFLAFAGHLGKPLAFPEWGLYRPGDPYHGGGDNPDFITRMADLFTSSNAVFQSYFAADWGGGTLDDFPTGKAAYRAAFGAAGG
ncbi:hypothetical protein GCM10023205_32790 [Yinghuangia aomiensis]|uniref:GH26 domain-containing protein n=1 Tax=Yinghuangia aomiensis TaxID=676205 RepID=A0ABP9HAP6_9ACTN